MVGGVARIPADVERLLLWELLVLLGGAAVCELASR